MFFFFCSQGKFIGNAEERAIQKETIAAPGQFDVIVTSYEMVIKEKNHFKKFHWCGPVRLSLFDVACNGLARHS